MLIEDKILEMLNIWVFGNNDSSNSLFCCYKEDTDPGNSRIGFYQCDLENHNYELWGNCAGRVVVKGKLEYQDSYFDYCKKWVESFFDSIDIRIFKTLAESKYNNVYVYLKHLNDKIKITKELNKEVLKNWKDLDDICGLYFTVKGAIGEEKIRNGEILSQSALHFLENTDWLDYTDVSIADDDSDFIHPAFDKYMERLLKDKDIILVSKLFADNGIVGRKQIERNEDGSYEIVFFNWNIWKDSDKTWIEKMGNIVYEKIFSSTSENLVIEGTYEELENMINLLRGDK